MGRWKAGLEWFLKRVTLRSPKRIILKSPPHTGRIKTLLELFPDARFVHIVRDPYAAVRLDGQAVEDALQVSRRLQEPTHEGLEEYVFSCFEQMYEAFERDRALIDPARFFEVRYEDLVRDPIEQMRALYEHLGLGEFETAAAQAAGLLQGRRGLSHRHATRFPTRCAKQIDRRWGPYMRTYGYCSRPAAGSPGICLSRALAAPVNRA